MSGVRLFGKLPAHGDFVRRGLPADMVAAWDGWAAKALAAAQAALGEAGFAAAWDAMPCWALALPAGACGTAPLSGVMAGGRDGVGRRFPLLLAVPGPAPSETWFATLAQRALAALRDGWDADRLAASLPEPQGSTALQGWWSAQQEWPLRQLVPPGHFHRLLDAA